jgi:hypothetical protein
MEHSKYAVQCLSFESFELCTFLKKTLELRIGAHSIDCCRERQLVDLSHVAQLIGVQNVSSYLAKSTKMFAGLVSYGSQKFGPWNLMIGLLFLKGNSM